MVLRSKLHLSSCSQWLRLYKAQVEPNLIFAAEASFDCSVEIQNSMNSVQMQFVRFILGLHSRSLKTLALADLGLIPIHLRRLHLTARYYQYVLLNP